MSLSRPAPLSGALCPTARSGQLFVFVWCVFCAAVPLWADSPTSSFSGDVSGATRYIVGGPAPDSPAAHVDPNVPTSPFAGVVSISVVVGSSSFIGSGVLIDSTHVLTAGHVVDVVGTDGIPDPTLNNVTVVFNQNNPGSNLFGADLRGISKITMNPNYNPGTPGSFLNDDLSILTLSSPAPAGVPIYALSNNPFNLVQDILMVGYGTAGDGVAGFTTPPNFFVKRSGENLASFYLTDDEGSGSKELFLFDFDGPNGTTDTLGDGPTFGNAIESTLGGGDSGGPSFLWNDVNSDNIIQPSELEVFGIDTFGLNSIGLEQQPGTTGAATPFFGSWGGGVLVSTYVPWIESAVPEPTSVALAVAGCLGVAALVRSVRRRPA